MKRGDLVEPGAPGPGSPAGGDGSQERREVGADGGCSGTSRRYSQRAAWSAPRAGLGLEETLGIMVGGAEGEDVAKIARRAIAGGRMMTDSGTWTHPCWAGKHGTRHQAGLEG